MGFRDYGVTVQGLWGYGVSGIGFRVEGLGLSPEGPNAKDS